MKADRYICSWPVVIISIICLAVTGSCFSVKYSTTGASVPAEAKTFSVQYFENQAPVVESGLSQQVTEDLKDFIQSNSRLTFITETGDVDFEGAITGYDIRPVAITAGEEAAKNRFTLTIRVRYNCYIQPEMNYETSFSRFEDYSSTLDFESVKGDLTKKILDLLIEDIFNKAFVNW
jgi:hypothetical protein